MFGRILNRINFTILKFFINFNLVLNATEGLFPAHPQYESLKVRENFKNFIVSRQEKSNSKNMMRIYTTLKLGHLLFNDQNSLCSSLS